MKLKIVSVFLLLLFLGSPSLHSQGDDRNGTNPTVRVLLVGDSWAELAWIFGSLDHAFRKFGHPQVVAEGTNTAIGGTTAEDWTSQSFLNLIEQDLQAFPTVDVVHISIGGNDFLGNWNAGMSPAEEAALFQRIVNDIETVIQNVLVMDMNIQVVLTGYDYVNFEEMRQGDFFSWLMWVLLGSPTPTRINDAMVRLSTQVLQQLQGTARVHYVNHAGLMQYAFGYPAHGIIRRSVRLPGNAPTNYMPFAGGIPTLPSPPTAMLDAIHLNEKGYDLWAASSTYYFYDQWFTLNP